MSSTDTPTFLFAGIAAAVAVAPERPGEDHRVALGRRAEDLLVRLESSR